MTLEKKALEQKKIVVTLIKDINDIHEKTTLHINEIDDKVNKSIALLQENKISNSHVEDLRIELWLKYTEKNIEKIEEFIKDLSLRLVKVGEYRKEINEIKRRFNSIKIETQNYKGLNNTLNVTKIAELFNETTKLWNKLGDNEEDMRRDAWFKFLSLLYLPFAIAVSGGYWVIIYYILKWNNLNQILIVGGLILVGLYFLLIKWAKNPFKLENKEDP